MPRNKHVGLVHHVPFVIFPDTNLGSRLEQAFLCMTHAKMYLAINTLAIDSCLMGKSTLFRKSDLELATKLYEPIAKYGVVGLGAFGRFGGEDNMIGRALWHGIGSCHVMTCDVASDTLGTMSIAAYIRRRVRWIRVRKYMVIGATLVEPITESLVCGSIGLVGLRHFVVMPVSIFFILHISFWFAVDTEVFRTIQRVAPGMGGCKSQYEKPSFAFFYAWLARELLALPIWLYAMAGNRYTWRASHQTFRVKWAGELE